MNLPWKILTFIFAVFLMFSIALNIAGFTLVKGYYRELHEVQLNPLSLDRYGDQPTDPDRQTVVFFGDSRAQQWPTPDGLPQFEFINRGVAGQTSTQVVLRFDAHVRPLSPDIIVLQMCVNDLKAIPLFPDQRDSIVATCKANTKRIIARSYELGATVILTTVFPVGEPSLTRRLVWSDDVAESVREVNDFIHSLSDDGVIVFDAYALLVNLNGLLRADLSIDELHLNPNGYALLNGALVELFLTKIQSQET